MFVNINFDKAMQGHFVNYFLKKKHATSLWFIFTVSRLSDEPILEFQLEYKRVRVFWFHFTSKVFLKIPKLF